MRIAFPLIPSSTWTGGYNYLLNLFRSIQKYQLDQITPILFCGEDANENDVQPFNKLAGLKVVRSPVFDENRKSPRLLLSLLTGRDSDALKIFLQYKIEAVFENATFFGWRFPIPAIAWMPDFQHRQLRDQFGFKAYWQREIGFRAQIASGRIIMLSSENARRDCVHFYPRAIGNTAVVRFAAPIPEELIEDEPEKVIQEYCLPQHFFYLPNQFWKHKNHLMVIESLGLLKKQGYEVVIAATGNPLDPRHPEYFGQLNARIESLGLQNNFRILGLVPQRHVISLMRVCAALINPSQFEGWSSTVEEARTLGVQMLLSDIDVHREQMGAGAIYFDPDDINALAQQLRESLTKSMYLSASRRGNARNDEYVNRFAQDFLAVSKRCCL